MVETGRSIKEIESGLFIQEEIKVEGEIIELTITSKRIEIKHGNVIKNRFNYSGEINKSIISDLATTLVDIKSFKTKKEARSWIVNNDIFSKINSAKRILDIKIKESQKEFKLDESLMVFNEDYISMAEKFWDIQPFYYDKSKIWWLWNFKETFWEMVDETDLFNVLKENSSPYMNIIKGGIFNQIIKAMQMVGRKKKPKEAPIRWIQFKDKAFSLRSKKIHNVTPDYFFTNPIPWEIGETNDTPFLDNLFIDWVGKEKLNDLYEFIAYCCYRNYPIQLLFCLYGHGRNGKSTFINIVDKFLGTDNTCTTELDMIAGANKSRFETIRLYKKLACFMGETNFNILENSSILKKLVGGDKIGYEVKGAGLFDDYNYAKIIIASNSLPSSEDTSEGFYRRWHIIDFPNEFPEGKDISLKVPNQEYTNLAKKVTEILPKLLDEAQFSNQGTIEQRKAKYIMASNPLPFFIEKFCYLNANGYIRYSKFYHTYTQFLNVNKRRIVSKKEFSKIIVAEGFENRRTSKDGEVDYYVEGVEFKEDLPDLPDFKEFQLSSPVRERSKKNTEIKSIESKQNTQDIVVKEEDIQDIDSSIGNKGEKVLTEDEAIDFIEDLKKNG